MKKSILLVGLMTTVSPLGKQRRSQKRLGLSQMLHGTQLRNEATASMNQEPVTYYRIVWVQCPNSLRQRLWSMQKLDV